jgi:predicted AAA+ superfamily ATPase
MEILRERYLQELDEMLGLDFIKVITGARRVGKSTLLRQFMDRLKRSSAKDINIVYVNLDDTQFHEIKDADDLYNHIVKQCRSGLQNYIFIDEIQNVNSFEKALESLYIQPNIELFITGSNSKMLSSEIATILSGRQIELHILPFSFSEVCEIDYNSDKSKSDIFNDYLEFGGFPGVNSARRSNEKVADKALDSIYSATVIKDIVERSDHIDKLKLERLTDFAMNNIGNLTSIKKISDTLTSNGEGISNHSVSDYLQRLTDSYIFYPAVQFDLRGKKLLKTNKKYYLVDTGLRRSARSRAPRADLGHALENVVFLELKRRFSRVWIGKLDENEVDFTVSDNDGNIQYIQVAYYAMDENTMTRELKPLLKIRDNHRKILLSLDVIRPQNYDGIQHINVIDWLLDSW